MLAPPLQATQAPIIPASEAADRQADFNAILGQAFDEWWAKDRVDAERHACPGPGRGHERSLSEKANRARSRGKGAAPGANARVVTVLPLGSHCPVGSGIVRLGPSDFQPMNLDDSTG